MVLFFQFALGFDNDKRVTKTRTKTRNNRHVNVSNYGHAYRFQKAMERSLTLKFQHHMKKIKKLKIKRNKSHNRVDYGSLK